MAYSSGFAGYLIALGVLMGARAPDYLEFQKSGGGTLIPHRTITHYAPLWAVTLLYALGGLGIGPMTGIDILPNVVISEILCGFAIGGISHLLTDLPNPMGIPLWHPRKRWSLNWWRSGEREWLVHIVGIVSVALFLDVPNYVLQVQAWVMSIL
jgi:hypothetical protein